MHTIQTIGFYQSPPIIDPYDLTVSHTCLQFSQQGIVRIGQLNEQNDFVEMGVGSFELDEATISFSIRKLEDGFTSKWTGAIRADSIDFQIEQADFEDIEGTYSWVSPTKDPPEES